MVNLAPAGGDSLSRPDAAPVDQLFVAAGRTGQPFLNSVLAMLLQDLNVDVAMIESRLLAMDPQLSMAVQMFNTALEIVETDIAGHSIGDLSTTR